MPCKCCVPGCRSNYRGQEYISMFTFPTDPDLKDKWLELIGQKDYIVKKNSLVCAKHFEPHFIVTANPVKGTSLSTPRTRVKLQKDALPTIFPPVSSPSSFELFRKRKIIRKGTEDTSDAENSLIKDSVVSFRSLCKEIDSHIQQWMSKSNPAVTSEDEDTSRCPQGDVGEAAYVTQKLKFLEQQRKYTHMFTDHLIDKMIREGQTWVKNVAVNRLGFPDVCQNLDKAVKFLCLMCDELLSMSSGPHFSTMLSNRRMMYKPPVSTVHSTSTSEMRRPTPEHGDKPGNKEDRHEGVGNNTLECVKKEISEDNISEMMEASDQKMKQEKNSLLTGDNLRSKYSNSNKKIFKCEFCDAVFDQSARLKAHISKHTGVKPFPCDMCDAGFRAAENLRVHIRKHTGEKPFVCDECGAGFISSKKLRIHWTTHTGEKLYNCDLCGSGFNRAPLLKAHMVKHTGVKPYRCEVCGVGFTVKSRVQIHMRKHTGEKPYPCQDCDARFLTRRQLKVHRVSHTGEKPYKCDVCGSGFNQAFNLQLHKRKHTGEIPYKFDKGQKPKPYVCEVCGQQFYSTSGLRQHRKKHTGKITLYKCDVCGVSFSAKISLINHQRKHTGETPYSCDVCGLQFSVITSLQSHQRKHTGEKPHLCDICGTKFAFKSSLQDHKRLHTGEKPFKCDLCGSDFSNRKKLKRHKKIHAGNYLRSSGGSSLDMSECDALMLV
ncbi:hypothetical protein BsWGS_17314 [Bradybaena similaris]